MASKTNEDNSQTRANATLGVFARGSQGSFASGSIVYFMSRDYPSPQLCTLSVGKPLRAHDAAAVGGQQRLLLVAGQLRSRCDGTFRLPRRTWLATRSLSQSGRVEALALRRRL